jgi:hypothetical protein
MEEKENNFFLEIGGYYDRTNQHFSHLIPLQEIKSIFLEAIDKAVKDGLLRE